MGIRTAGRRLGRRITLGVTLLAAVVVLTGVFPVASWLSRPLMVVDPPGTADAIVVLGAGVHDDVTPSFLTLYRLLHGIRLFREQRAPTVILTGGNPEGGVAESDVMAAVATTDFRLPASALVVEREASRTVTQARAVARVAHDRGIRSVVLVTSDLHSFRAVRAFRRAGLEVWSSPARPARRGPPAGLTLHPADVIYRVCGLVGVGYEYGAIALYWWKGWI